MRWFVRAGRTCGASFFWDASVVKRPEDVVDAAGGLVFSLEGAVLFEEGGGGLGELDRFLDDLCVDDLGDVLLVAGLLGGRDFAVDEARQAFQAADLARHEPARHEVDVVLEVFLDLGRLTLRLQMILREKTHNHT